MSHVTVSGVWGGGRCHMLRFLRFGGRREKVSHVMVSGGGKMSHVTVSGVWREEGKGVTCYGFCGLEGGEKRCHMLRFLWFGGRGEKVHCSACEDRILSLTRKSI